MSPFFRQKGTYAYNAMMPTDRAATAKTVPVRRVREVSTALLTDMSNRKKYSLFLIINALYFAKRYVYLQ